MVTNCMDSDLVEELFLSELRKDYDPRKGMPHDIIISSLSASNTSNFASILVEITEKHKGSNKLIDLLAISSRILFDAHILDRFDRERLRNYYVKLSVDIMLCDSPERMAAILNCINSLKLSLKNHHIEPFREKRKKYPYHWLKALCLTENYSQLCVEIREMISSQSITQREVDKYLELLQELVPNSKQQEYEKIFEGWAEVPRGWKITGSATHKNH